MFEMYHYAQGQSVYGPVPLEELRGRIGPQTLVWREPMPEWKPASELPELSSVLSGDAYPSEARATAVGPAESIIDARSATVPATVAYAPAYLTPGTPGLATASLVLGIISLPTIFPLFCLWPFSIAMAVMAISFGFAARSQCRKEMRPGAGMALAGIIMGFIPITIVLVCVVIFVFAMVASAFQ